MTNKLPENSGTSASGTGMATYAWAGAIAAVAGFAAVYVIAGRSDNAVIEKSGSGVTAASGSAGATLTNTTKNKSGDGGSALAATKAPAASGINPLSTGDMVTFVFKKTPAVLPEISFMDGTGKAKTLKDWRGKVVLLNLWATWCAPCRREMPEIDALQGELGSDRFEVIALSVDRKGLKASKRFLDQIKVKHLAVYNDKTGRTAVKLRAIGMPTTLLIDAQGREIGRLVGPANWHSEDAKRLIRAQLRP